MFSLQRLYSKVMILAFIMVSFFLFSFSCLATADSSYNIHAWRAAEPPWPEDSLEELQTRSNSAFLCSGGGTRAYTNGWGYIRGIHLANLPLAKYQFGVSGGSWFTSVYAFTPTDIDDATLMGPYEADPSKITMDFLDKMDDNSALAAPTRDIWWEVVSHLVDNVIPEWRWIWQTTLYEIFLRPLGFPEGQYSVAWDENQHVLPGVKYIDVRPNRPFPVIGSTLVCPKDTIADGVFPDQKGRNPVWNEITPLYVGQPYVHDYTYNYYVGGEGDEERELRQKTVSMGGFVEPHGYGSRGPVASISGDEGDLTVSDGPIYPFDFQRAIAHSSWVMADWIQEQSPLFNKFVSDYMNYWSPVDAEHTPPDQNMFLIGDGGIIDDLALIAAIRRGVTRIVAWDNADQPLVSKQDWDPFSRDPTKDDLRSGLAAYFGYFTDPDYVGQDLEYNHIFEQSQFAPFMDALQVRAAQGYGAVATMDLTTIDNDHWGIKGGQTISVTYVYLSRVYLWERQLNEVMKGFVVPDGPEDPKNTVKEGPFEKFPGYSTIGQLQLTRVQVNLLAHMCTWVVFSNQEHFDVGAPTTTAGLHKKKQVSSTKADELASSTATTLIV